MDSFVEADEEQFEIAVESLDDCLLATIRAFFELVSNNEAVFRLVSGTFDKGFNRQMVNRAGRRIQSVPQLKVQYLLVRFGRHLHGNNRPSAYAS